MLTRLRVRDLAVVADASLEFGPGLNVVTGETGAGKSLLLGAVGLLVGERGSGSLVRPGAASARVEAVFEPSDPSRLIRCLRDLGLSELEEGFLILRRDLTPDGRTRAFVGNEQVLVSTLRALGEELVDLHGQGDEQFLLRPARQRECLDHVANALQTLARLHEALDAENTLRERIEEIRRRHEAVTRERDFFQHQLREIEQANLAPGEEEELRNERRLLMEASRVSEHVQAIAADLTQDDGAALERVSRAEMRLEDLAALDAELGPARSLLENARLAIEEVSRAITSRLGALDFSPQRRDEVEERLDLIAGLRRKYGRTEAELLTYAGEIRAALDSQERGEGEMASLVAERDGARRAAAEAADRLSELRARAALSFARGIEKELPDLGMKGARFEVRVTEEPDPESWYVRDGRPLRLRRDGGEEIEFVFSANPGQALGPLAKIASGGELSRVMLALKVRLSAAAPADVMIFDEVDSGVGGRTARAVAERIRELAAGRQVIAITHLAQVACLGERHYRIEKTTDGRETKVTVDLLSAEARVGEIARMLSGQESDRTARRHARELLGAGRARTPSD